MSRVFDGCKVVFYTPLYDAISEGMHGKENDILKTLNGSGTGSLQIHCVGGQTSYNYTYSLTSKSISADNNIVGWAFSFYCKNNFDDYSGAAVQYKDVSGNVSNLIAIGNGYGIRVGGCNFQVVASY